MNLTPLGFNKIIPGDTLKVLQTLPNECIDCIVTSPPYYALRDYGVKGQIGLEQSLDDYLEKMLAITAELKRVLKPTGTLWWNHGDSYGTGSGSGVRGGKQATNRGTQTNLAWQRNGKQKLTGYEKCLLLQAYRLAMRMVDEQRWILRNILIWHKPNCMPSSAKDRFTVDYESIFFFSKSKRYWFETQYEAMASNEYDIRRMRTGRKIYHGKWSNVENGSWDSKRIQKAFVAGHESGRNKRCVWRIPTRPFKEAHFATFPERLIEPIIRAGCPEMICRECGFARKKQIETKSNWQERKEKYGATGGAMQRGGTQQVGKGWSHDLDSERIFKGYTDCGCNAGWEPGIVLDPFMGAGTTAVVAERLGRRWLGIELNPEYIKIAERRILESRYQILKPIKSKREKFQPIEPNEEAV